MGIFFLNCNEICIKREPIFIPLVHKFSMIKTARGYLGWNNCSEQCIFMKKSWKIVVQKKCDIISSLNVLSLYIATIIFLSGCSKQFSYFNKLEAAAMTKIWIYNHFKIHDFNGSGNSIWPYAKKLMTSHGCYWQCRTGRCVSEVLAGAKQCRIARSDWLEPRALLRTKGALRAKVEVN